METLLWIVMLIGWLLFGIFARLNARKNSTIKSMEKAHQADLDKEFHRSFNAGWKAASTDPTTVKSAYYLIFQNPDRN